MAGLVELLQTPVIIRPWGEESCKQHGWDDPPSEARATDEQEIGEIHGGFHGDHRREAHTEGGAECCLQSHPAQEDAGLEGDASGDAAGHGNSHDNKRWRLRRIGLKPEDSAEVANRAS